MTLGDIESFPDCFTRIGGNQYINSAATGAWEDFLFWLGADRKMATRITRLIGEIQRDPFAGIGKPEPLKGDLSGYWSRRIDDEHRLVYRANEQQVKILKARYHYSGS